MNYAWDEFETIRRLAKGIQGAPRYKAALRWLTAASNERLFRIVEESSVAFEQGDLSMLQPTVARDECKELGNRLMDMRNSFIARNIDLLKETVNPDCASGPVMAPQIH